MNGSEIRVLDRAKFNEEMQRRAFHSRYMLVGVCAWISLCLLLAGWVPDMSSGLSSVWLISGLLGLCSSVGLARMIKIDARIQEDLLGVCIHAATTDGLTGLANRNSLDGKLTSLLKDPAVRSRPLSMAMVDIDHFKAFNDQWGHQAGDAVLRSVGKMMREHFGKSAFVARYGGEEFAVVLPGYSLQEARNLADSCRESIKCGECCFRERRFQVTISGGVTEALPEDTVDSLTQRADLALYTAKRLGRDLVWVDTLSLATQAVFHQQETDHDMSMTAVTLTGLNTARE